MEYFVAVVEEKSFTRAARRLNVTQSALSHQVKALEREVGGLLLERLSRGLRLTPMGRAFLPDAELAVRSARQARRAARAAAGAGGGELHIATLQDLAAGVLPDAAARLRAEHPNLRLVVHEFPTADELLDRMARGVADLALAYSPDDWDGPVHRVGQEEMRLVLPPEDPLRGQGTVRLAQLADRDWIRCTSETGAAGRSSLDRACAQAGFVPRTAVLTHQSDTAVRLAAAGAGVGLVPSYLARTLVPSERVVAIDPPWRRDLVVYLRTQPVGAAEALLILLKEVTPRQSLPPSGEFTV